MRRLALRLGHRRRRLLELELALDELEQGAVLAVHLRDLADALGEAPLPRGKLAAQLGHVGLRPVAGDLCHRIAELVAERLDLGLEGGRARQRGVALDRQRLQRLVQTRDLGDEALVLARRLLAQRGELRLELCGTGRL